MINVISIGIDEPLILVDNPLMHRGRFIVIDGIGGCGKTTHAEMLLRHLGKTAILTHEPGGAPRAAGGTPEGAPPSFEHSRRNAAYVVGRMKGCYSSA